MLAQTLDRLGGRVAPDARGIVPAGDLAKEAERQAPHVPPSHVIGEPVGKNTAPAIGLMAWWLEDRGTDTVVVVLPSDHRVEPAARFQEELREAARGGGGGGAGPSGDRHLRRSAPPSRDGLRLHRIGRAGGA